MNIQIFGTKKCNDTRKAERFFKERGIKYQFIDMKEKGMSKGEFTAVAASNGGMENLLDENCKDQDTLFLIKYLAEDAKLEKILENPQVLKTPVVRNGKRPLSDISRMCGRSGSENGTITRAQYNKSFGDLVQKMGMEDAWLNKS